MKKQMTLAITTAILLAGCASSVKKSPDTAVATIISSSHQVASVSMSLSDEAKVQYKDNRKFSPDELLRQVRRGLDASSLLSLRENTRFPALEIQVKELRVRSNLAATVFGSLAGPDFIVADVVLKDADAKILDRYEVTASYGFGGLSAGQDSVRMAWLYENFTNELMKELAKK